LASTKSARAAELQLGGSRTADLEHVGVDVEHRHARGRAARAHDAEGDVAGAAGHVEMVEGKPLWRVQHRHEAILPQPVQTDGHQVVHEVVARRDLVEDVVDAVLLLVETDVLEAEVGGLGGIRSERIVVRRAGHGS